MPTEQETKPLSSDVPIADIDEDNFSFSYQAKVIAEHIQESFKQSESLVIGITAPWGAGKTSLINLVLHHLGKRKDDKDKTPGHLVFKYSPWIVGDHETILANFLPALERKLRFGSNTKNKTKTLRSYSKYITKAIRGLNSVSGSFESANMTLVGLFVKLCSWIASLCWNHSSNKSLDDLRQEAIKHLDKNKVPVLVILDDIDRLEPSEVLNIFRLVQSTANLPYVVYILSYDQEKVAEILRSKLDIDGQHYLEKIIQLPIKVPEVSPFLLGMNLKKKLNQLFLIDELSLECKDRLEVIVDSLSQIRLVGYPRDIPRLLNIIKFRWRLSEHEVDPGDATFVWNLEMKCPSVYSWVKDYTRAYKTYISSLRLRDPEDLLRVKRLHLTNIIRACENDSLPFDDIAPLLHTTVPGFSYPVTSSEAMDEIERKYRFNLFETLSDEENFDNRNSRRLASDIHWRNYFSYEDGTSIGSLEYIENFVKLATEKPDEATDILLTTLRTPLSSGGTEGERIIDLIESMAENSVLSHGDRFGLLHIIANSVDLASITDSEEQNKDYTLLWKAQSLAMALLKPISPEERKEKMYRIMENGRSVTWILFFIRNLLKAHGRLDFDQEVGEAEWLDDDELRSMRIIGLNRIHTLIDDSSFIEGSFEPKWIFYAWHDLSDEVGKSQMRQWVRDVITEDSSLLRFVKMFSVLQFSSDPKPRWSIVLSDLRMFIDIEEAIERINELSENPGILQEEAQELKKRIEVAKKW